MASFNKVILLGNLTRDPELRFSQSGMAIVKFGLAMNEKYKDKETVTFVDITAFGKTGEAINSYLKKGDPIHIDGKLDFSTWEDKNGGGKRSKLAVILNTFTFIGGKATDGTKATAAPSEDADFDGIPF